MNPPLITRQNQNATHALKVMITWARDMSPRGWPSFRKLSFEKPTMMKAFLVGVFLSLFAGTSELRAAERPNILWITAEDMSPNIGSYGDSFAHTPNLDAFGNTAVKYTRAYSAAPVCSPSRVALVTGVYANSLGNPHLRSRASLPAGFHGYPFYLGKAGYYTSNNFKSDYNLSNERAAVKKWWDRSDDQAHWRHRSPGQPFMAVFNIMDTHQSRSSAWPQEQFEREIGSKIPSALRADPARVPIPPFYPDTPASRRAMARYYDCITAMDMKVGELLKQLDEDGLADDTIVFFYSDHGMGMPRGKRLLHDSGMRVPLLVRFPPKWAHLAPMSPGEEVDRLVTFVDFPPTLLSLVGVPIPQHFQGVPFLGNETGTERRYVYGSRDRVDEAFDTARSVRDERWLYIRNYRPHLSWAPPESYSDTDPFRVELLKGARKMEMDPLGTGPLSWLAPTRPREELYDYLEDPYQLRNLAQDPQNENTLKRMRDSLSKWMLEIRDIGFLAEEEVSVRTTGMTPYAMARAPGAFDMERILTVAESVGDPDVIDKQIRWLADLDSGVRYWAAVGLAANHEGGQNAIGPLKVALGDTSAAVRIEAAGALFAANGDPLALGMLAQEIWSADLDAALHAARTLELIQDGTAVLLPELTRRLLRAKSLATKSTQEFYISMALGSLVDALSPPPAL